VQLLLIAAFVAIQAGPAGDPTDDASFFIADTNGLAGYWSIEVTSSGDVVRQIASASEPRHVEVEARRRLANLVLDPVISGGSRLFGRCVIDGRMREVRAIANKRRRSIQICDLPTSGKVDPEARQAVRIWYRALDVLAPGTPREPNDARILAQQH
jgi:hypothetical protein